MKIFIDFFITVLMHCYVFQTVLLVISSLVHRKFLLYLDLVITKGLLLSVVEKQPYALCPWSPIQEMCVQESEFMALVDVNGLKKESLLSLPGMVWTCKSFHSSDKLVLLVYEHGVVNGSLKAQWMMGSYSAKISPSGRLTIWSQSALMPMFTP